MKHSRLGLASLLSITALSMCAPAVAAVATRRREPEQSMPTEPHKGPVTREELTSAINGHIGEFQSRQARDKAIAAWNLEVIRKKAEKKARRQAPM